MTLSTVHAYGLGDIGSSDLCLLNLFPYFLLAFFLLDLYDQHLHFWCLFYYVILLLFSQWYPSINWSFKEKKNHIYLFISSIVRCVYMSVHACVHLCLCVSHTRAFCLKSFDCMKAVKCSLLLCFQAGFYIYVHIYNPDETDFFVDELRTQDAICSSQVYWGLAHMAGVLFGGFWSMHMPT